ncbi:MAG: RecX family transcriptional regulator [Anaerolineae bacterium]|jgi:regulatory protein
MAEITALKYQKKNQNRVNVYLDGRFALGVPDIVAATLKVGQELSEAEIEALKKEGDVETAYGRTLDYLSYRPRSRNEVVRYLQKRDMGEQEIELVLERLERAGLVDDEEFARFWVENRERFRPRGLRALRYELRQKGVSDRIIDRAVAEVDVSDSAYRSAEKKARQWSHLDYNTFRRKLVAYLSRRGFNYEVAREVTDRHWAEQSAGD